MKKILLVVTHVYSQVAIFALAGSWIANPVFHVHYRYLSYFGAGLFIAFIGESFMAFPTAREFAKWVK